MYADYSAGLLTGEALAAAGFTGAIRYAGTPGHTKNTTRNEVLSLLAAGLDVHGVFELGTADYVGGYSAGVISARALLADATACGIPGVLFMTADQHITDAMGLNAWREYLRGAQSVLGSRMGAYGFTEAIAVAQQIGVAYLWQCGGNPSLTNPVTPVNIWQRNSGTTTTTVSGIEVDINDVINPIGGIMELGTTYTDWDGNQQTVQSTFDHIDQRTAQLAAPIVSKVDPTVSLSPAEMLAYIDANVHALMAAVDALSKQVAAAPAVKGTGTVTVTGTVPVTLT